MEQRLRDFVRGDEAAFETLFREYQREVYGWIVRLVRDRSAAEDLTIETFWRIHRSPPGGLDGDVGPRMRERLARGRASPSPWDWALVAAMAGAIIAFPRIVIGILYHL